MTLPVKEAALREQDYIVGQRRWLHAHPELSCQEKETTAHIAAELENCGVEVQSFDDITGAIGIIRGTAPGKTVMLPIDDADTGIAYVMAWSKALSNPVGSLFVETVRKYALGDDGGYGL